MKISGVLNKERFFALSIDSGIALIITFFMVILARNSSGAVKGVILAAVYVGYFIVLESLWSRTPGKYHQGLIVRKLDGSKIGFKEALARGLMILVEINPLLLGGLPAGLAIYTSDRKQRLGDMIAGTVVVSDKLDPNEVEPPVEGPPPPWEMEEDPD